MICRRNCLNLKSIFEPYDIDEDNQTVIENGQYDSLTQNRYFCYYWEKDKDGNITDCYLP